MATSVLNAITAVEQALRDGHGNARTLAADDRFAIDTWPTRGEAMIALLASVRRLADVRITSQQPLRFGSAAASEMLPRADYLVTFTIECGYYLGHEALRDELRAAYDKAAGDFHRIRGALCFPSNLATTSAGAATGLVDGCLSADLAGQLATWQEIVNGVLEDESMTRVLLTRATFPAIITLDF